MFIHALCWGEGEHESSRTMWQRVEARPGPHFVDGGSGWIRKASSARFLDGTHHKGFSIINVGDVPLFPGIETRDPQCGKRVRSLQPISQQAAGQAMQKAKNALATERYRRKQMTTSATSSVSNTSADNLQRLQPRLPSLDMLDMTRLRPHSMRHSGIVHIVDNGNHVDVAAAVAGHRTGSRVTRDIYNSSNLSRKRKATEESMGECLRQCGCILE
eukprot:1284227-Amphidinium_carterae.1